MFPQVDEVFTGTVVAVEPFGSFVEHPDGHHGLLHTERLEVGASVRVRVLAADEANRRFSLTTA